MRTAFWKKHGENLVLMLLVFAAFAYSSFTSSQAPFPVWEHSVSYEYEGSD